MKTLLQKLVLLSLLTTCGTAALAQSDVDRDARESARIAFQEANPEKLLRWNDKNGVVRAVISQERSQIPGTPTRIASQFLNENRLLYGIESVEEELELYKTRVDSIGGVRFFFAQSHKGLPVESGELVVYIDRIPEGRVLIPSEGPGETYQVPQYGDYWSEYPDWNVRYVGGRFFPGIANATLRVSLSGNDVRERLGAYDLVSERGDPSLIIVPTQDTNRIAYRVAYRSIYRDSQSREHNILVDADSGEILRDITLMTGIGSAHGGLASHLEPSPQVDEGSFPSCCTTVSGDVWVEDKGAGSEVSKSFPVYTQTPVFLDHPRVKVIRVDGEDEAEVAYSGIPFDYTPGSDHFDEVMAFYHTYKAWDWLWDNGMASTQASKVTVRTGSTDYAGSNTNWETSYDGTIPSGFVYPALEDAAVIVHEYAHHVVRSFASSALCASSLERCAIGEGYADFFGVVYRHEVAGGSSSETDAVHYVAPYYFRKIENTDTESDLDTNSDGTWDGDLDGNNVVDQYDAAMLISGSLWDYWAEQNQYPLSLILAALDNLTSTPDFEEVYDAMITASAGSFPIGGSNTHTCSSACETNVESAFGDHGFGFLTRVGMDLLRLAPESQDGALSLGVEELPAALSRLEVYPNPFASKATVRFGLKHDALVRVRVFNLLGEEVSSGASETFPAGSHDWTWDIRYSDVSDGTYIVRLEIDGQSIARSLALVR